MVSFVPLFHCSHTLPPHVFSFFFCSLIFILFLVFLFVIVLSMGVFVFFLFSCALPIFPNCYSFLLLSPVSLEFVDIDVKMYRVCRIRLNMCHGLTSRLVRCVSACVGMCRRVSTGSTRIAVFRLDTRPNGVVRRVSAEIHRNSDL